VYAPVPGRGPHGWSHSPQPHGVPFAVQAHRLVIAAST
jgi:hypothetical protein